MSAHRALPLELKTGTGTPLTVDVLAGELGRPDDDEHADRTLDGYLDIHILYVPHLGFLSRHSFLLFFDFSGALCMYLLLQLHSLIATIRALVVFKWLHESSSDLTSLHSL